MHVSRQLDRVVMRRNPDALCLELFISLELFIPLEFDSYVARLPSFL